MKHAVRALGWTTNILWITIIAFTGTAIYSALNLSMSFGQPQVFFSDSLLIWSFPISVNNTSYYDISELNLTVTLVDHNGSVVSTSTTFVPLIPRSSSIETANNVSLNLNEIIERAPSYLFNDTVFNVNISMGLRYAYVFAFQFSHNTTIDWGAPLYNFSTGGISYQPHNSTYQKAIIPVSFENHSPFLNMTGMIRLEIYNDEDYLIGSGITNINVQSYSLYEDQIEAFVESSRVTEAGSVHLYFETSLFSFGPLVMNYG